MFEECEYMSYRTMKMKKRREVKHDEFWKRAKNVSLHVQSRKENEFVDETLQPERHPSRWEQHYERHVLQAMYPLGEGW